MKPKQLLATVAVLVVLISLRRPAAGAADQDGAFEHPVFRAIVQRDDNLLASLLRESAPVDVRSPDGTTPLLLASLHGSARSVRLLLQHGADPNAANDRGVTPLIWAAGDVTKVRLLLKHDANVNVRSALGNTPLISASAYPGNHAVVELLLQNGADAEARNNREIPALLMAVQSGDQQSVRLLLDKLNADQSSRQLVNGQRPRLLAAAAEDGHGEIFELLLEGALDEQGRVANPAAGWRPLQRALLAQRPDMARRLIQCGASLTRTVDAGRVPPFVLSAYTETGDVSIARLMIDRGIDVTATNDRQETALTWARRRGHTELIELLEQAGVPDPLDKSPEIPHRQIKLDDEHADQLIRQAAQRSIDLMQHSSDVFLRERRNCVSCHHQNLPAVALGWASDRGLSVDRASTQRMIDRQMQTWSRHIERAYQMDDPVPVPPRFLGWGLWGVSALGCAANEQINASVWYLSHMQQPDGRWISGVMRPPMGDGDITATVLAMRSLQLYPLPSTRQQETTRRVQLAARWLEQQTTEYHQQRVFQLLGLAWAGRRRAQLNQPIRSLLDSQNDDGGWSQLDGLTSDAWATGAALVALKVAGALQTNDPAYRHGVQFLLSTQFDDGSWFIKSRTWPFQPPFESGFPHGHDQWISVGGTAWATMALVLALDPPAGRVVSRQGDVAQADRQAASEATDVEPSRDGGAAESPSTDQPVDGSRRIEFARDIVPILQRSCVGCHHGPVPESGLRMTDRQSLLTGGDSGQPALVAGRSADSPLYLYPGGKVKDLEMPPLDARDKYPPLTASQLETLRAWIDQGAAWPEEIRVGLDK